MTPLLQLDEVHVVSDLHLGGADGFQIFGAGAELARFVDHLAGQPAGRRVALVINGDFVDFLAEAPSAYFDPAGATAKLDRVVGDPAFAAVFAALQRFTAAADRILVVNLGNHDLELALPWVREHLLDILCGGIEAARGRIRIVMDGAGFACRIGAAKVLCLHGNEVDPWNVADYERLRRIGRDLSHGRPVEPWIPNAGTQLVIDVMNGIKRDFPFVDLLKPEAEGAVPTLLALDPGVWDRIHRIGASLRRVGRDRVRMAAGFLAGEEPASEQGAAAAPLLPPAWGETAMTSNYGHALLDRAEQRFRGSEEPLALIDGDEQGEYLGLVGAAWKLVRGRPTHEVLAEALEQLDKDRSFDFRAEDDTYTELDRWVGGEIDFIVAGHTHLERALRRRSANGWYFNSGTWARLIKLEADVRGHPEKFKAVFDAFKGGTMAALDAHPGLVLKRPTVVALWAEGNAVHGELRRVNPLPDPLVTTAVKDSRFTRD